METTKYKTSKPGSFIEVSLSYYKGDDYGSRKRGYYASFNLVALSDCGGGVTIRKFSKKPFSAADLIRFGSVSPDIVRFLAVLP